MIALVSDAYAQHTLKFCTHMLSISVISLRVTQHQSKFLMCMFSIRLKVTAYTEV
jgi:hypothetical protein